MSLASGCPWRQDSRGELSRVRSVASGCPASIFFCVSQKLCGLKVQQSLISTDFSKRQCLEHWHSFEYEIAAIPVISFCTLIYYLSSQHRCPNPNLMKGSKEKEKNNNNAAQLYPIERLVDSNESTDLGW